MARIDEIAPDVYRVSLYAPQFDLQFNHFLIRDDEPLLFHTGMRRMFPEVRDAVATLIDPAALRWISWSHFEVDECGALNEWLAVAPRAQAVCSQVGAMVNIQDFASRPPRGLAKDEVIDTGRHRYRFVPTPHLPHGWDAGVLFEETSGVLLCSDLFHQLGDVEPVNPLARGPRRLRGVGRRRIDGVAVAGRLRRGRRGHTVTACRRHRGEPRDGSEYGRPARRDHLRRAGRLAPRAARRGG